MFARIGSKMDVSVLVPPERRPVFSEIRLSILTNETANGFGMPKGISEKSGIG
jgi:hypothetical protein